MEKKKSSNKYKRELISWGLILSVIAVIYFGGLGTEVLGTFQRGLLATGIFNPNTTIDSARVADARYEMPLTHFEGDRTSLQEFKGQPVFLNFWATWCAPCIAEMPNIQKLYSDMKDSDVAFVIISVDEDPQKARDFIDRKNYDFPVYFMPGRRPAVFNSPIIPTTYIISPEGEIVFEKKGMANYNNDKFKKFLLDLQSR